MFKHRLVCVLGVMACLFAGVLAVLPAGTIPSQAAENQPAPWNLERAYWRYVEKNDLSAYRGLWHQNFLGWPSVSAAPVNKDHITDWITSQTSKGLTFKSVDFKPAAMHVTGDVAVTYYWISFRWLDKNGQGETHTLRITHTWLKQGKEWRIIGGMSMPEPATLQK